MATFSANYQGAQLQRAFAGVDPTTLFPPGRYPIGTEFWDDSTLPLGGQKLWRVQLNTGGTAKVWVQVLGGGAGNASWPNYVVSADNDVPAPYATIVLALAAAVAAGHGAANPVTILVHPGTYSGALALTVPGIAIMGFAPGGVATGMGSDAVITGAVSITPAAIGHFFFENMSITTTATITVAAGSAAAGVLFRNCTITSTGVHSITWTNVAGTLEVENSSIRSTTGMWLSAGTVALDVFAENSQLLGLASTVGMTLASATVSQIFQTCFIIGQVSILAAVGTPSSPRTFLGCNFITTGVANPAFTTSITAGGQADIIGGSISCASTGATFGVTTDVGAITLRNVSFASGTLGNCVVTMTLPASLKSGDQPPARTLPDASTPTAGTTILTTDRTLRIPAIGAARTYLLDSIRTFPDGTDLVFSRVSGAADADDAIISAGAGDTVGGTASITLTDAAIGGCMLRADVANRMWLVVSTAGTYTVP